MCQCHVSHNHSENQTILPHIFGDGHLTSQHQQIKEFVNCKLTVEDEIHFLLECPKLEEARHDNLYNIENKYKNFESLANVSKFIWLMSAEDTYSQLYQLLNKLNNLRHEILSNNN